MNTPPESSAQAVFCGRDGDLDRLRQAWRVVSEEQRPQLVALLAESGLGKTRLVQEFYAWLAQTHRSPEGAGYWPPQLGQRAQNLVVTPDLTAVDGEQVMPFLWWALRLVDPEGRNTVLSSAVAAGLGALTPHLQPMYRARRHKRRWLEGGKIAGGAALGFIPIVSGLLELGQAAFELEQLRREGRSDRALTPEQADRRLGRDLNERIVSDLEQLFRVGRNEAAIPMVWVVDDAHFSPADPAVVGLFTALLAAAQRQGWPLLIVVTHWEQEWHAQREDVARPSVATAIAEGYRPLNPAWRPHHLAPIDPGALAPALAAGLPGLTPEQAAALLARTGGNPRFLDEIVRLCRGRARYFADKDLRGALTDRGLAAVLEVGTSLHDLVEARLHDTPQGVRSLVTLSSLQGVRLLYLVSERLIARLQARGYDLSGGGQRRALELAHTPYAFLNLLDSHLAEFSQQVFFEVAREGIEDLVDAEDAEAALIEALRELELGGHAEVAELSHEEQGLLLGLAAEVLARSGEPEDRRRALVATALLAGRALEGYDHRAALRFAERALAGAEGGLWRLGDLAFERLFDLSVALVRMGRLEAAAELALLARAAAEASGDRIDLISALNQIGGIHQHRGAFDAALATYRESLAMAREVDRAEGTPVSKRELSFAIYLVGNLLRRRGDLEAALATFQEGLDLTLALVEAGFEAKGNLSDFYKFVGIVHQACGDAELALEAYRASLALLEELFEASETPSLRRDLRLAHTFIGNVHWERRELDAALHHYQLGLDLALAPIEGPWGAEMRRDLGLAHGFVGDVHWERGELDAASESYRASLAIARELAESVGTPDLRSDLAEAFDRVAAVLERRGELDAALESYGAAVAVHRELTELLANPEERYGLGTALLRLGDLHRERDEPAAALEAYREGLELVSEVAEALGTPAADRDLSLAFHRVATTLWGQGELKALRPLLEPGLAAAQRTQELLPSDDVDEVAAWFEERLAELERG